jgi:hypothetical protein
MHLFYIVSKEHTWNIDIFNKAFPKYYEERKPKQSVLSKYITRGAN